MKVFEKFATIKSNIHFMRSIIYPILRSHILLICLVSFAGKTFPQQADSGGSITYHTFHDSISNFDSVITLPHRFIVSGSEAVLLDSLRLIPDKHYSLQSRSGTVILHRHNMAATAHDTTSRAQLTVSYRSLPFDFRPAYRHREAVMRYDSSLGEQIKVSRPSTAFSFDDLFGSNLQKSGTIVRGLSIASNRDLTLNSGFRMQMSGNLTGDLQIIAALTDENTPIQPEGTTQSLQEIDKVFVEIRSPDATATLGDFNMSLSGNEFGRLNRKLQGARGFAEFRPPGFAGDVTVAAASARGRFTTNLFQGQEGVQGPYRLTGQNGERTIVIVAGTEHVYVNGERM
ncbi:MAG TPA: hypothetical protein VGR15_03295, partial [Bacteroidota bacterium]|nr:hypothetical protein [Bacteroidota bacterium]